MRLLISALLLVLSGLPALAFSPEPLHGDANGIAARLAKMPGFDGGIVEDAASGLEGYRTITLGGRSDGAMSARLLARGNDLIGIRFDIPLLPKADPGLYAFTEIATLLEPEMADLKLNDTLSRRDALKGWASEIGIESWMRPRYGAYRVERRVGDSLFVFEGQPLQSFWIAISHAGNRHPVLDRLNPFLDAQERKAATPVLTAVERGEYARARTLVRPHVERGAPWAMLVIADYGEPVGEGREMSLEINRMLEGAADAGYAPAQHVLGQPDSNFAEARLKKAAAAGYAPALALKARRLYASGRADDPGARCEELVALQGDAMAQLRTVYRYAEGGGRPDTAYFWGRVTLETFGEASSITIDRYILHTLGVLEERLSPEARAELEADAADWKPKSFAELKPRYEKLGCLD
ncbi:hypothetical protein [Minwuia sp.]|uniref:hypothetical protein n=1 Tax=Minwuia sp. TaxID=2493630 RepID=UPI003A8D4CF7